MCIVDSLTGAVVGGKVKSKWIFAGWLYHGGCTTGRPTEGQSHKFRGTPAWDAHSKVNLTCLFLWNRLCPRSRCLKKCIVARWMALWSTGMIFATASKTEVEVVLWHFRMAKSINCCTDLSCVLAHWSWTDFAQIGQSFVVVLQGRLNDRRIQFAKNSWIAASVGKCCSKCSIYFFQVQRVALVNVNLPYQQVFFGPEWIVVITT